MKLILILWLLCSCNMVSIDNTNAVPQDGTDVQDTVYVQEYVNTTDTVHSLRIDTITVIDTVKIEVGKLTKKDSMMITRYVMCQAYRQFCD